MTADEHQRIVEISQLQIHEYFNHYLTDVFPRQIGDIMDAHNGAAVAHEVRIAPLYRTKKQFEKFRWMILGGAAVVGCVGGLLAEHLGAIIKLLLP